MAHVARLVAWAGIAIGLVYLVLLGAGGYFGITSVWFRIPTLIAIVVALAIWLVVAIRDPFWRPRSSLAPALIAALIALGLALLLSERPELGADYVAYAVILAGAYLLLVRLFAHPFFAPRIAMLAPLLCFGLCFWYIGRVFVLWSEFWSTVGRLTTPPFRPGDEALGFGNPGTVATMVILLWVATVADHGLATNRARALAIGLGIPVAFVVLVTGARGAWLGLAVAGAVLGVVYVLRPDNRAVIAERARSRTVQVIGVVVAVAAVVVGIAFLPAILNRLAAPASEVRSAFFATALRMFQDDPVSGVGPGMWAVERIRYTLPSETDWYIPHAHNVYLQTVAELGLLGAIAGVVVLVFLVRLIRAGLRSGEALVRRLAWATLFSLVYLAVHQFFDFYMNLPAVGFALALTVGRLDALIPPAALRPQWAVTVGPSRLAPVALAIVLVPATLWLVRSEVASADGQIATDAANRGDWAAALDRATAADAANPGMPPYLFTRGLALAHEGRTEEALAAIRQSAEGDDYPIAWLDVAALEAELGNDEAAAAGLEQAMRVGFQNSQVATAAVWVYLRLGDVDGAVAAARKAFELAPTLAGDPTWRDSEQLANVRRLALDELYAEADPITAFNVALEATELDNLPAIIERMPEQTRPVYENSLRAWTGDAGAFEDLRSMLLANPLDLVSAGTCHRFAAHGRVAGGDPTVWNCDGAAVRNEGLFRIGQAPDGRLRVPGPDAPWHFHYVYRRLAPSDELVPGLPHLTLVPADEGYAQSASTSRSNSVS